jgi:hypothetical protein
MSIAPAQILSTENSRGIGARRGARKPLLSRRLEGRIAD